MESYRVTNAVFITTLKLQKLLDVNSLLMIDESVTWDESFPHRVVMRSQLPKYTALLNVNGKVIITGVLSKDQARQAVYDISIKITTIGFEVGTPEVLECVNMTAAINIQPFSKYNELSSQVNKEIFYEPEVFPGMIYHFPTTKLTAIIYHTGKLIITGARDTNTLFDFCKHTLLKFNLSPI